MDLDAIRIRARIEQFILLAKIQAQDLPVKEPFTRTEQIRLHEIEVKAEELYKHLKAFHLTKTNSTL